MSKLNHMKGTLWEEIRKLRMRFHTAMRTPQSWVVVCGGCELVSSLHGSQSKKEFTVGDKTYINRVIYWFFREGQLAL